MTSATRSVAEFVARASFGEALAHVEDVVAGALLDTYGVSLVGDATQAAQAVRGLTGIQGLYDVAANATGSARADAAMLGGTAAHALDFDDYAHMGHASAVLIPTLLALSGERYGPSRFAEAYAAGYEVWERIARSAQPHYAAGFHTTATVGTLGAASCAARLLAFDEAQVAATVGVAGSLAGGLLAAFGTDLKPVHAGLAASGGIRAALLVREGLAAPLDSLDAPAGFLTAYLGPGPAAESRRSLAQIAGLLDGLGPAVLTKPPAAKPYPCCAATHGAIEAALDLRSRIRLAPDERPDLVSVVTPTLNYADALAYHEPRTALEGKFCMEYCVSVAFVRGHVGLAHFTDEAVIDADVRRMMQRVRIETDPRLNDWLLAGMVPARIEVSARGETYVVEVDDPVGGQTKPMRQPDIVRKFRANAAGRLPAEQVDRIAEASASLGGLLTAVRAALTDASQQHKR